MFELTRFSGFELSISKHVSNSVIGRCEELKLPHCMSITCTIKFILVNLWCSFLFWEKQILLSNLNKSSSYKVSYGPFLRIWVIHHSIWELIELILHKQHLCSSPKKLQPHNLCCSIFLLPILQLYIQPAQEPICVISIKLLIHTPPSQINSLTLTSVFFSLRENKFQLNQCSRIQHVLYCKIWYIDYVPKMKRDY